MTYTETQKKAKYLYRERHPEKWREYMKKKAKEYYTDEVKGKKKLYYLKKKEEKESLGKNEIEI